MVRRTDGRRLQVHSSRPPTRARGLQAPGNDTTDGRQRNRRVEVRLIKTAAEQPK